MLTLSRICLTFGDRVLFDDITFSCNPTDKIGLVGRNGVGKSTLFKVIAGLIKPDSGTVSKSNDFAIEYLAQEIVLESQETVFNEAMRSFEPFIGYVHELEHLEQNITHSDNHELDLDRMQFLYDQLNHFDLYAAQEKTKTVLYGLGFNEQQINGSTDHLSVGWKMRLMLAKQLLHKADFYLFDEPTNHLDIVTKNWFLIFLQEMKQGFMLISHDQYFLKKAVSRIIELERGHARLYEGNFDQYLIQKEEYNRVLMSAHSRQEREIAQKQATIERFRASASKAKMAQSMIKQLARIERIEIEPPLPTITLKFPPVQKSAATVLTLKNISFGYNDRMLFDHINGEIMRGERVALIAPNGTGKSTLFNIIAGKLTPKTGSVTIGNNVTLGIFEQDQHKSLNPEHTIIEEIHSVPSTFTDGQLRGLLGSFLFPGDDVYKKIKVLSGGEKNRVAMVKLLAQQPNVMLLDEPTNHLDLYAQDILRQSLQAYDGTILFVSHDQTFVNTLANRILELTPHALHSYPGSYETYVHMSKNSLPLQTNHTAQPTTNKPKTDVVLSQTSIKQLESAIIKKEAERDKLYKKLESIEATSVEYTTICKQLQKIQDELTALNDEWNKVI